MIVVQDDTDTGMEDSSTNGDEEENELESREESAEKVCSGISVAEIYSLLCNVNSYYCFEALICHM